MKLSSEEEQFLRHWMHDEIHYQDGQGPDYALNTSAIIHEILEAYAMPLRGFHGVVHWARVLENGQRLATATGAKLEVVTLFALFHVSRRVNEHSDFGHGHRGARYARSLACKPSDGPDAARTHSTTSARSRPHNFIRPP
jgi:HD superfamily phosphodiesterase